MPPSISILPPKIALAKSPNGFPPTAYKVYLPVSNSDSLGQSWSTQDDFQQSLDLCKAQTVHYIFEKYLTPNMQILEAGCGLGRWVFYLRQKGYSITGIEISETALTTIEQYNTHGFITKGDVLHLPYMDESLDAVISLGVVEHFEEGPQKALAEARRVLKDNGLLLISIPPNNLLRKLFVNHLYRLKTMRWKLKGKSLAFAEYRFSVAEFKRYLMDAGYKIEEIATDELEAPLNIGLYSDFPSLHDTNGMWMLNHFGRTLRRVLDYISPAMHRGGVHFVCRKSN